MRNIKFGAVTPLCVKRKRFCGLPKGVSKEPRTAAMFSKTRTGTVYFSLLPARKRIIVSGTKMMRETSFVTNIEEKKTEKTKKIVRPRIVFKWPVRCKRGRKIFSFLKPSRTESSIKRVARVCQFISYKSFADGGVIKREAIAAKSETESISSFLKRARIFLSMNAFYFYGSLLSMCVWWYACRSKK